MIITSRVNSHSIYLIIRWLGFRVKIMSKTATIIRKRIKERARKNKVKTNTLDNLQVNLTNLPPKTNLSKNTHDIYQNHNQIKNQQNKPNQIFNFQIISRRILKKLRKMTSILGTLNLMIFLSSQKFKNQNCSPNKIKIKKHKKINK